MQRSDRIEIVRARHLAWSRCLAALVLAAAGDVGAAEVLIGERPVVERHVEQGEIDSGQWSLEALADAGRHLFDARFNVLDGQGRPASTGTGADRIADQPAFVRTSGPDANACSGCHAQPESGGAGDFVANVFVLAQARDPVTLSVGPDDSNERNTLGMFGSGAIEMLAREMSAALARIRNAAAEEAARSAQPVTRRLFAKGVHFGSITVLPDGRVDPSRIEGVDWDLIVKPFHQKGAVVSLREFSNNAMNHHHGMQSVERFGAAVDADQDGIFDELTIGDITAISVFQAALRAPTQVHSAVPQRRAAAQRGQRTFDAVGCGGCHMPYLVLEDRFFSEPGPYNPPGNLGLADVAVPFRFDLVTTSASPSVRAVGNEVRVRAFTDLKRHDLNDAEINHFANERLSQGTLAGFADEADFVVPVQPRPTGEFLTRKLWDVGNSGPYGHRGDLTTLTEAILQHGGDARRQRDAFAELPHRDRADVIEFLKSLVVAPAEPVSETRAGTGRRGRTSPSL